MKHLIKYKDGHVGIMNTTSDDIDPYKEILKWHESEIEKVDSHSPLAEEDIPKDLYFRDAWIHLNGKIHVHLGKCREIHANKLRELRKPKLESLDVEFMKAFEEGDEQKKARVSLKKMALRDITKHPGFLNAATPEELKAFMPDILKED